VFDQSWGSEEEAVIPLPEDAGDSSATGEADALFFGWLKHPDTTRAASTATLRRAADSNFIRTSKTALGIETPFAGFVFVLFALSQSKMTHRESLP
jgi:hypothetical protein